MKTSFTSIILVTALAVSLSAQAQDVNVKITENKSYSTLHDGNELIKSHAFKTRRMLSMHRLQKLHALVHRFVLIH